MSINTNEIFKRMDIQQFRAFILEGLDTAEIYNCKYDERLEKGEEPIIKRLKKIYKDEQEFSDAFDDFCHSHVITGEVYTEIGMKAGARLMVQLLYEND